MSGRVTVAVVQREKLSWAIPRDGDSQGSQAGAKGRAQLRSDGSNWRVR